MKSSAIVAAAALIALASTSAKAENIIEWVQSDATTNRISTTVEGNGNTLTIVQEHFGGSAFNSVDLVIEGDLNGGPLGASFSGVAAGHGLRPGSIIQQGFGNSMEVAVLGSRNLFAFQQTGSGNALQASIVGFDNQAAVQQVGIGNNAVFSQNGNGNIVSITQHSF